MNLEEAVSEIGEIEEHVLEQIETVFAENGERDTRIFCCGLAMGIARWLVKHYSIKHAQDFFSTFQHNPEMMQ